MIIDPQTRDSYRQLQEKVSDFFARAHAKYSDQMRCGKGCFTCCTSGLRLNALENDVLKDFLARNAPRTEAVRANVEADPHRGQHCVFLDGGGRCLVYEVRPLVCRSHGAPLQFKNDRGETFRDVCPLNFESMDVTEMLATDVLNMETMNAILAVLNMRHAPGDGNTRYPMSALAQGD